MADIKYDDIYSTSKTSFDVTNILSTLNPSKNKS